MASAPKVFRLISSDPDPVAIAEAAAMVRRGGLVAFPTETVYGIGADASNPTAIERLNQVKGRPPEKPYSLHLVAPDAVRAYVTSVPPLAARLIERFWPGPLTLVLPGKDGRTVGLRVPDHPIARAFLAACQVPVVAPSANRAGRPPPTDAQEVLEALDGALDGLLDGGPTRLGRESTVVEVVGDRIELRREGAIAKSTILEAIRGD